MLSLRLDGAYTPRVDVMWSLPITPEQAHALGTIMEVEAVGLRHLPVVGIEVEGTTPSTKTLASDVANIAALGTKLGLLVVSEAGEAGIYRRATRTVRSLRRSFGDLQVVPLEASWLEELGHTEWHPEPSEIVSPEGKAPAGGESLAWSSEVRTRLRKQGQDAGFIIAEPYRPNHLGVHFDEQQERVGRALQHMSDPVRRISQPMSRWGDFYTKCEIDLAWLLPLPRGLGEFLKAVETIDPHHREHGILYPELHDHIVVAAFELESSSGKHAGGGLLNLSAYSVIGVAVTPSAATTAELDATLRRYQPTLGLRNVVVRTMP